MLGNISAKGARVVTKQPPRVAGQWLYGVSETAIRVDTAAWFAWLDSPLAQSFAYPLDAPALGYIIGYITVRKERRQRGGHYWVAYRRDGGRLRKVYLGRTPALTQQRLQALAEHWLAPTQETS